MCEIVCAERVVKIIKHLHCAYRLLPGHGIVEYRIPDVFEIDMTILQLRSSLGRTYIGDLIV
jgi:hypothetical protein